MTVESEPGEGACFIIRLAVPPVSDDEKNSHNLSDR
jgi:signal transduction histidine kinase